MLFLCPEPNMELQNRCECGLAVSIPRGGQRISFRNNTSSVRPSAFASAAFLLESNGN